MRLAWGVAAVLGFAALAAGQDGTAPIRLPEDPALSPDGATLAFAWRGDLWTVSATGGVARPLTQHPARESQPCFSPDGRELAFVSDRDGARQVHVMPATGGTPVALTAHSEGSVVEGWFPDGRALLVSGSRDHDWVQAQRLFQLPRAKGSPATLLLDAAAREPSLAPDGRRLLVVREGVQWWRKGYTGASAAQVWLFDLVDGTTRKLLDPPRGAQWPLWRPDGQGYYYVGATEGGTTNVRVRDLDGAGDRALTTFRDDGPVFPTLSRDGRVLVFRVGLDLWRLEPAKGGAPVRLDLREAADTVREPADRRTLTTATAAAFSADGLEVVCVIGGDLFVMDTELRDPRRLTDTPEEERQPVFSPDGQSLYFVSDRDGRADLWRATRGEPERYWWQGRTFPLARLTDDPEADAAPRPSPDGKRLAWIRGRGDLMVGDAEAKGATALRQGFEAPDFDWSPDSRWLAYAADDADFNRDVWLARADGSAPAVNVSRHPDNESDPVFSPDGRCLAFTGRRIETEVDIWYVWLRQADEDKGTRERTVEKALEKIEKARKKKVGEKPAAGDKPVGDPPPADTPAEPKPADPVPAAGEPPAAAGKPPVPAKDAEKAKKPVEVVVDFERIHERLHRLTIANSSERELCWAPDSKKLGFLATVEGKEGLHTVGIPDEPTPKLVIAGTGSGARWLEPDNQIVWLAAGVPASVATATGKATPYPFTVRVVVDRAARFRAAFDLCWRTMRDWWYDERLGNRDWAKIREKYLDAAAGATDAPQFAMVVSLMLGELNGSHLGFGPTPEPPAAREWRAETAHLGLRFDPAWRGAGWKVRDVLVGGPAERAQSRIVPGEVVTAVDGTPVDAGVDPATVLNGPLERDVRCTVQATDAKSREVTLRPIGFGAARQLCYEAFVRASRAAVTTASGGRLGYLHIGGMNWPAFHRFEAELYAEGAGKDGLVLDVRENGGGFTADHLLTVLTQPRHAITVPRGGAPGYPQDRKVYATWDKPIVVLCNQRSFSNAEIFAHAVKTLGRGKVVGVPTAGGVISTGAVPIMDLGTLRLPTRGWFRIGDGEDMEMAGAVPDVVIWPEPLDSARGVDRQLAAAVEVLQKDVAAWLARPQPKLRRATER